MLLEKEKKKKTKRVESLSSDGHGSERTSALPDQRGRLERSGVKRSDRYARAKVVKTSAAQKQPSCRELGKYSKQRHICKGSQKKPKQWASGTENGDNQMLI